MFAMVLRRSRREWSEVRRGHLQRERVPFRRHESADGLGAHPQRCGDPHLANRWVDAQAEIFDSLVNDIDENIVQLDLCEHSITRLSLSAQANRLRQGYGGPPKLRAKAEACALRPTTN